MLINPLDKSLEVAEFVHCLDRASADSIQNLSQGKELTGLKTGILPPP